MSGFIELRGKSTDDTLLVNVDSIHVVIPPDPEGLMGNPHDYTAIQFLGVEGHMSVRETYEEVIAKIQALGVPVVRA